MEKLDGTWLTIKTGNDHSSPEFIEFHNNEIVHFDLNKNSGGMLIKIPTTWKEKISETKYEFVNDNRIRIFRMGKNHISLSETESTTEDIEIATDYEKIKPTKTELTASEIQKLKFKARWKNEILNLVFNKYLNRPIITEALKNLNRKGRKLKLENLQGTYFVSIYENDQRDTLLGIKEVDIEKAILFGFPEKPYEIMAN